MDLRYVGDAGRRGRANWQEDSPPSVQTDGRFWVQEYVFEDHRQTVRNETSHISKSDVSCARERSQLEMMKRRSRSSRIRFSSSKLSPLAASPPSVCARSPTTPSPWSASLLHLVSPPRATACSTSRDHLASDFRHGRAPDGPRRTSSRSPRPTPAGRARAAEPSARRHLRPPRIERRGPGATPTRTCPPSDTSGMDSEAVHRCHPSLDAAPVSRDVQREGPIRRPGRCTCPIRGLGGFPDAVHAEDLQVRRVGKPGAERIAESSAGATLDASGRGSGTRRGRG